MPAKINKITKQNSKEAKKLSGEQQFLQLLQNQAVGQTKKQEQSTNDSLNVAKEIEKNLNNYLLAVKKSGRSKTTIRNYKSDIKQFLDFLGEKNLDGLGSKPKLLAFAKYQREKGLKDSSIKRKIVSVSQFKNWLKKEGLLKSEIPLAPKKDNSDTKDSKNIDLRRAISPQNQTDQFENQQTQNLSSDDETLAKFTQEQGTKKRRNLFGKVSQASKISRKRANKLAIALNVIALLFFIGGLGYLAYQQFGQAVLSLAYPSLPTSPNRILSFQGRLTNTARTPIAAETDVTFELYDDVTSGNLLWSSNTCAITPDQDGIFSTNLGAGSGAGSDDHDCGGTIDDSVFTENSNVWLEVTVGTAPSTETLTPRQPIRTVAYAINSETVQGIRPSLIATHSTLLMLNDQGELVLGTDDPEIKTATGSSLMLEADSIMIQTQSGSDGDIVLAPDGVGNVGIGTTDPIASLHTSGSAAGTNWLALFAQTGITPESSAVIDSSQNAAVAVQGDGKAYFLGRDVTNDIEFIMGTGAAGGAFAGSMTNHDFWLRTNNADRLTIKASTGRVGIGDTDPGHMLDVAGSANLSLGNEYYINDTSVLNATTLGSGVINSSLTSVGTLTSGTWNASTITEAYGGTNQISYATGDMLYASAANTLAKRTIGDTGHVLTVSGGVPVWAAPGAASNVPLSGITAATAANTIASGDLAQVWNWALTTAGKSAFTFGESSASTATGDASILTASTLASSTAIPLYVKNLGNAASFRVDDSATDTTPFVIDASGSVGIGTSTPGTKLDVVGDILVQGGGNLDTRAAGTLAIGGTTQSGLTLGRSGTNTTINGDNIILGSQATVATEAVRADRSLTITQDTNVTVTNSGVAQDLTTDRTWTLGWTGLLAIARGGTNSTATPTAGTVAYGTGDAYAFTVAGDTGQLLTSQGAGAPTWTSQGDVAVRWDSIVSPTTSDQTLTMDAFNTTWNFTSGAFRITNNSNEAFYVGGGKVGIGDINPGHMLDVAGSANLSLGNEYYINDTSVLNATTLGSGVINSSLTSVGTLTSGTWNASTITEAYGGTNQISYATGDMLYASAANTLAKRTIGDTGHVLTVSGGVPVWAAPGAASNVPLSGITAATAANTIASGDLAQVWNWALTTAGKSAFTFGESSASTATGDASILTASTLASSTAIPLYVKNLGNAASFRVDDSATDTTPFVIDASGSVGIGTSTPGTKLDVVGDILVQGGGNLDTRAAGTLAIGGTTQSGLTLGRSGTNTTINGDNIILGSQATVATEAVRADRSLTITQDTNVTVTNSGVAQDLTTDRTWTLGWTGLLAIARGGTNSTATPTAGTVAYGTGDAYAFTVAGDTGQLLTSQGAGAPTWTSQGDVAVRWDSIVSPTTSDQTLTMDAFNTTWNFTSGAFRITNNTDEALFVGGSSVGIGTITPGAKLDVVGAFGTATTAQRITNTTAAHVDNIAQIGFALNRTTGGITEVAQIRGLITDIGSTSYKGALAFLTSTDNAAPTEKMRIRADGNVGIGVTNPGEKLVVDGSAIVEKVMDYSNNAYFLDPASSGVSLTTAGSAAIGSHTPGTARLAVIGGNLGIGTTAPEALLQIGTPHASQLIGNTPAARLIGANANSTTTETLLRLVRKGATSGLFPAVADFNVFSYSSSGSGPGTQLDIVLKSTASWTETADAVVMTLKDDGTVEFPMSGGGGGGLIVGGTSSVISNTSGDITIAAASDQVSLNSGSLINFAQLLGASGSAGAPTYSFSTDSDTGMYNPASDSLGFSVGGSDALHILSDGSVAIGDTSTSGTLDVVSSATPELYIRTSATSAQDAILHLIGARTTSTTSDIGQIRFTDSSATGGELAYITARKQTTNTNEGNLLFWTTTTSGGSPTEKMRLDKDGNLGIGKTAPLTGVHSSTNVMADNALYYNYTTGGGATLCYSASTTYTGYQFIRPCASTQNLKEDIKDLGDGLDTLMQLTPREYIWREDGRKDLGFIAEEIEQINPMFATYLEGKLISVNYVHLTALLTKAIQELNLKYIDFVEKTNQRITQLNNSIATAINTSLLNAQKIVTEQIEIGGQTLDQYIKDVVQLALNNDELITSNNNLSVAEKQPTILAELLIENNLGENVASIDNQGNAQLAGNLAVEGSSQLNQLTAEEAEINSARMNTASVSGELHAQSITTDNLYTNSVDANIINGLQERLETAVAKQLADSTLLASLMNNDTTTEEYLEQVAQDNNIDLNNTNNDTDLNNDENNFISDTITAHNAYIDGYFEVNGSALIEEALAVKQTLLVGEGLTMGDGYIAFQNNENYDLSIQPAGRGRLSLMADLLVLDESGLITIGGDLKVAGTLEVAEELKVKDTLLTNLIRAENPDENIRIQLAQAVANEMGEEVIRQNNFEFIDEKGEPIATMSASGDLTLRGGLKIDQMPANASASADASASANINNNSAGQAVILAGQTEVKVKTSRLTENSMIYITPLTSTNNQVIYIKNKLLDSTFTIENEAEFIAGFDFALNKDVQFNWWIVN